MRGGEARLLDLVDDEARGEAHGAFAAFDDERDSRGEAGAENITASWPWRSSGRLGVPRRAR